jgi:hypothetical protein
MTDKPVWQVIAEALINFKPEPPKEADPTLTHDFLTAEYMRRVQTDAETAEWILKNG